MCDRRLLIPALFNPRSPGRQATQHPVRPSETARTPRPAFQGVAAPLSFITRRRIRPVPSALPLRRGQGEVSIRFRSGGYARAINLQDIDFAHFNSLSTGDRARTSPPPEGGGGRRPAGEDRNDSAALPPPSPAATPPPLGGGLSGASRPPSRRREPSLNLTARRSLVWKGHSADTALLAAASWRRSRP